MNTLSGPPVPLHFKATGAGEPLIILHGLFGGMDNWSTMARSLAESYHVFTIDQRNHGASPKSDVMNYDAMASDLELFMNWHDLESANLVGHSMGGKAAMRFATLHPERVRKLVVVDIAPRRYESRHLPLIDAMLGVDLKHLTTRSQVDAALAEQISDAGLRKFLLKSVRRDPAGALSWAINLKALRQNSAALNEALPVGNTYSGPTLFIKGGQSDYIEDADLATIRSIFPRAELKTIAGAGHLIHAEAPAEFLSTLIHFLRPAGIRDSSIETENHTK